MSNDPDKSMSEVVTLVDSLKLPNSAEDWLTADMFFHSVLVPQVCSQSNIDDANLLLVSGIYQYFFTTHGVISKPPGTNKRSSALSRRLSHLQRKKELHKEPYVMLRNNLTTEKIYCHY